MTVIADKVLVVFLDEALSAADNSAAAAATSAESKAFSEVAALGCNGFLVLPEITQGKRELSDLESVLGVVHDGGNAQFKFPKMPVAFFSASSSSCALAKSLGFEIVYDITTPTAATEASASAKELLTGNAKQLVFLHLDAHVSEDHWVHALVLDLLLQQERDADSRCLVALVQSARQPHHPQQNAGSSSSPFWPRQSYEKVNGQYAAESSSSSTTNAELRRLLLSFYQKDRTRRDAVQRFDEAQIDALGSYGAMSALMFLKEVAFRLGFAPKIVSIDKGFESHSGITEIDKRRGPKERSNWKKQQKSTTKKQEGTHSLARSQVSAYKAFSLCVRDSSTPLPSVPIPAVTLSAKHWTRGTSSSRRATAHEDDSDDDRATMYQAVSETEPMLADARSPAGGKGVDAVGTGSVRSMRLEAPSPRCNDWIFAALFIVNVAVIGVFAFAKGLPVLKDNLKKNTSTTVNNEPQDLTHVFILSAGLVGGAVVLSLLWMKFLMAYAESMIRIALWFNVGLTVVFALTTFAVSPIMACLLLLMAGLNVWYIYAVQDRIGFASANLKTACAAVSQHSVIFLVALLLLIKQTIWMVLWSLSAIGIYQMVKDSDPGCDEVDANGRPQRMCGGVGGGFTLFFMLISVYWGQQVLQNILTCTTAGVVASWWYQPNSKKVTAGALYRSLTSSFGSICFGSLIVAVLQALRTMASILKEKAREDDNGALACVACLAECILNCLEGIMEYINQWAYVYVGIYGYDFKTSGKAVMDLFTNRGWTAVINDDLTSSALTFGALGVGVVTCVAGLLVAKFCPDKWFEALGSANTAYGVLGTIGFIAGMSMAMILANVVITALHTVFVCFAEDPIAFSRNHPREYEDLVSGWRKFHGDALVSAYGGAV